MALRAMNAHRMRTFLTMLGIIIGIASVVAVVALGTGARQAILSNISSLGTNTIRDLIPGSGFGDLHSARVETLTPGDSVALARQPFVDSATPGVATSAPPCAATALPVCRCRASASSTSACMA